MFKKKSKDINFCDERGIEVKFNKKILKKENKFNYLGLLMIKKGELDVKIFHRIKIE